MRALEPNAFTSPMTAASDDEATPVVAVESADSDEGSNGSEEDDSLSHTTMLESLDDEEDTLLRSIETVRQNRRRQVVALGTLAEIREQARLVKADGDSYGAAALEFAVGYHKAALAWLKSAPVR